MELNDADAITRPWLLVSDWANPFSGFRDAREGSAEQRASNLRFNRHNRSKLGAFLIKWLFMSGVLGVMLNIHDRTLSKSPAGTVDHWCAAALCALSGIGFSLCVVVIMVISVCWLFLSRSTEAL
jgi:hypothetical protein